MPGYITLWGGFAPPWGGYWVGWSFNAFPYDDSGLFTMAWAFSLALCIRGVVFRTSVAAYTGRHFGDCLSETVSMLIFPECWRGCAEDNV
ncbi:hypothetical protein B0I37DRAFT_372470 [Chaetomium sp. MPI-CAGE-AT-0009]|nr:hypothetical protein B0I37DRAFT_372470 [Chaetomium sp. MPI-CAGE-AT-0009]